MSAKLKLSKAMCQDDPPDLSPEVMEASKARVDMAKEELKQRKERLDDAQERMRVLLPEWQERE